MYVHIEMCYISIKSSVPRTRQLTASTLSSNYVRSFITVSQQIYSPDQGLGSRSPNKYILKGCPHICCKSWSNPNIFCKPLSETLNPWQSALHILECMKSSSVLGSFGFMCLLPQDCLAYCCNWPNIGVQFPKQQASIFNGQILH